MSTDFDKDKFLDKITAIPGWVITEEDFKKLCKHLYYRLSKAEACNNFFSKKLREQSLFTNEVTQEYIDLLCLYDDAYNNGPHPKNYKESVQMTVIE